MSAATVDSLPPEVRHFSLFISLLKDSLDQSFDIIQDTLILVRESVYFIFKQNSKKTSPH